MSPNVTDPTRYVSSASTGMLLLGILQLVAAGCVLLAFVQDRPEDPPAIQLFTQRLLLSIEMLEVVVGFLLLICSVKIKSGRKWAATTGLVATSCALCFYVFVIIAFLNSAARSGDRTTSGIMLYCAAIVVGCVVTLLYLMRSFEGIRVINGTEPQGFEVLDVHRAGIVSGDTGVPPVIDPKDRNDG